MELSICIVSWNTRELLASCLSSISLWAGDMNHEVIVVDNGSRDGTPSMLRERFPGVRLIANSDNQGFAQATNQAIRASTGRYVLLLNSDTRMMDRSLHDMLAFMDEHAEVGAAGACLLNPDGTIQVYPTVLPSLWGHWMQTMGLKCWPIRSRFTSLNTSTGPREVERVKGACMLVRREALTEVGPLDEDLFLYGEEDDWCLRLREAGWKVFYLPHARVIHHGRASVDQVAEEMFLQLYKSKVAFYRKHRGPLKTFVLKGILFFSNWPRLAIASARYILGGWKQAARGTRVRACWRLLLQLPRY